MNVGDLFFIGGCFALISNSVWSHSAGIAFSNKYMGSSSERSPQPWRIAINPYDVYSGDSLTVSKIRALGWILNTQKLGH